jgi:NitT/TauT family transport system permease protein
MTRTAGSDVRRHGRFVPRIAARDFAERLGLFLVFIGVWQLVSLHYSALLVPSPRETFDALKDLLENQDLVGRFWISIRTLLIALGLAIGVGTSLGLALGSSRRTDRLVTPYLDALYVTPEVMLIPVFIIWFGINTSARVAFIFVAAYFPIVVNTMTGVRAARGELADMGFAFGAGRLQMVRWIYFPGALPMMLAGIRLGLGRGVVAMITSEMFLAITGVGFLVVTYGNRLATAYVFALVVVVSTFGIVVTRLVAWVGRKIAPWSEAEAGRGR